MEKFKKNLVFPIRLIFGVRLAIDEKRSLAKFQTDRRFGLRDILSGSKSAPPSQTCNGDISYTFHPMEVKLCQSYFLDESYLSTKNERNRRN